MRDILNIFSNVKKGRKSHNVSLYFEIILLEISWLLQISLMKGVQLPHF